MICVVDASVIVDILVRTADAPRPFEKVFDRRATLHAPHLLDIEIAQVLRRFAARGEVDPTHGAELIALLAQLPIARHPHGVLLGRIWQLRQTLTAYDAAYAALAEGLRATLLTRDAKLASAPGINATGELL